LHILLHELGQQHDRLTNRSRGYIAHGQLRGEYALEQEARVWEGYAPRFGID
jgi:hypothetical protein